MIIIKNKSGSYEDNECLSFYADSAKWEGEHSISFGISNKFYRYSGPAEIIFYKETKEIVCHFYDKAGNNIHTEYKTL